MKPMRTGIAALTLFTALKTPPPSSASAAGNKAEKENTVPAEYMSIEMNYNSQPAVTLTPLLGHAHMHTFIGLLSMPPSIRLFFPPSPELIKQKCKRFN